jgi:hypothetical protein
MLGVHYYGGSAFVCGEDGDGGVTLELFDGDGFFWGDVGCGWFGVREDMTNGGTEFSCFCGVGSYGNGGSFGGDDDVDNRGLGGCGSEGETFGEDIGLGLGDGEAVV